MRRTAFAIALLLAAFGASEVVAAAWIHAKGFVAQKLIAIAWQRDMGHRSSRAPWPGADLRPVARLSVPARHVDLFVMDDASRRSLAFGPGLVAGTAVPPHAGNTVIVAHRDTHFTFLRRVAVGDEIDLQAANGAAVRYRVREATVVDRDDTGVMESDGGTRLTLITCYPFDAVRPGTRLRYVVVADRVV